MKIILLICAFGFFSLAGFSQVKGRDYVIMKADGKIYWIRSGQTIKLGISVPLKDGSVIYPSGVHQLKDGSKIMLKKGDRFLMDGTEVNRKK